MKNYLHDSPKKWPIRAVLSIKSVPNYYDNKGHAVEATLDCGHQCILTGTAIETREVRCKVCGEEEKEK